MKITIYTITDCPFCKQLKDYLASKNLQFEEKNLETNREWLSEMLESSDKFAGVPFTHVVKDDGSEVKLKGFTQSEFDAVFAAATDQAGQTAEQKPADAASEAAAGAADQAQESNPTAAEPAVAVPPAVQPAANSGGAGEPSIASPTTPVSPVSPASQPSSDSADNSDKLGGLLDNLQKKASGAQGEPSTPPIPDFSQPVAPAAADTTDGSASMAAAPANAMDDGSTSVSTPEPSIVSSPVEPGGVASPGASSQPKMPTSSLGSADMPASPTAPAEKPADKPAAPVATGPVMPNFPAE